MAYINYLKSSHWKNTKEAFFKRWYQSVVLERLKMKYITTEETTAKRKKLPPEAEETTAQQTEETTVEEAEEK